MKKTLFVLLLLILAVYAQECIKCEEVKSLTPTKLVLISDETNYLLKIYVINMTNNQGMADVPLIIYRYNGTDGGFEKVYADKTGIATYDFKKYKDECNNYRIMYCSCNDNELKQCCLAINGVSTVGMNVPLSISQTPDATTMYYTPATVVYKSGGFPATETYGYCKPKEVTNTPAFCLPLTIVFALLGGALMMTGRNPLRGFDMSGARVGKHIRYDSRGRYIGYNITSVLSTVAAAAKGTSEVAAPKTVGQLAKGRIENVTKSVKEVGTRTVAMVKGAKEIGLSAGAGKIPIIGKGVAVAGGMVAASWRDMAMRGGEGPWYKRLGQGSLTKTGFQMMDATARAVNPKEYIRVGGTVERVETASNKSDTGGGGSLLGSLLSVVTFGAVSKKDVENEYTKLQSRMVTQTDLLTSRGRMDEAAARIKDAEKGATITVKGLEFTAHGDDDAKGKTVTVNGKEIKIIDMKGNAIIYEEDGKVKVAGLTDKTLDQRKLNQISNEIKEKIENKVEYLTVKVGEETYKVVAGSKSKEVVVLDFLGNVVKDENSKKIQDAYKSITGVPGTKFAEWQIGKQNEALGSYREAVTEYSQARSMYLSTATAIHRADFGDVMERTSKEREALAQNPVYRKEAERSVVAALEETDKSLAKKYNASLDVLDNVSTTEYAAAKLNLSKEMLERHMTEAGFEGNVAGYLSSDKAQELIKTEQLTAFNKLTDDIAKANATVIKIETTISDGLEKRIDKMTEQLRAGSSGTEAAHAFDNLQERDKLQLLKNVFDSKIEHPNAPLEHFSNIEAYNQFAMQQTAGKWETRQDGGISVEVGKDVTVTVVPDRDKTNTVDHYEVRKGDETYLITQDKVYRVDREPVQKEIEDRTFVPFTAQTGEIAGYTIIDKDKKVYQFSIQTVEEDGVKKQVPMMIQLDQGMPKEAEPAVEKKLLQAYLTLPEEDKIGAPTRVEVTNPSTITAINAEYNKLPRNMQAGIGQEQEQLKFNFNLESSRGIIRGINEPITLQNEFIGKLANPELDDKDMLRVKAATKAMINVGGEKLKQEDVSNIFAMASSNLDVLATAPKESRKETKLASKE